MNDRYVADTDSFQNIFSNFLPEIQRFLTFWDSTMVCDESEQGLEIEEIKYLFNKWRNNQNEKILGINDERIIDIICYYYPDIVIESEKYISINALSIASFISTSLLQLIPSHFLKLI